MATIGEYLTALAVCRDNLAAYLTEKGVAATETMTVEDISERMSA